MPKSNPEVDRYIEKAAPFAQPILAKIRAVYHEACPEIEETIKWGVPHFDYKGPVGNMAAFKKHVSWGFWKRALLDDPDGILPREGEPTSMGGTKVFSLDELPSEKVMADYIRRAVKLNEEGVKVTRPKRAPAPPPEVPDDLAAQLELKKNAKARATFESFPPSHKREYIEWITEARQEATRQKRLAQTIEWLTEGKSRNWKYEKTR